MGKTKMVAAAPADKLGRRATRLRNRIRQLRAELVVDYYYGRIAKCGRAMRKQSELESRLHATMAAMDGYL